MICFYGALCRRYVAINRHILFVFFYFFCSRNFICEIKHDGIRYATVEILCMWPASSWSTWNTSTVQLQPDMAIVKNFKSCPSAQKGKKPNWSNFTVADAGSQEKNCKNFAQITKLQSVPKINMYCCYISWLFCVVLLWRLYTTIYRH